MIGILSKTELMVGRALGLMTVGLDLRAEEGE